MKRVRMGMVGGGRGSFIGQVHRMAAILDGACELVCGVFSRDEQNNQLSGDHFGLPSNRVYSDYSEMMLQESKLPESERMEFVVIVTPNHLHWPVAEKALQHGFHVLSDKPATMSVKECQDLKALLDISGLKYGISHCYTAYPMVKEARQRVQAGMLGAIRKIVVEYSQDWLAQKECEYSKQAQWRLDPKQNGQGGCIADIGIHAANLAEYISGLNITHVCADLDHIVPNRQLDDDGNVLLKFNNDIKGVLIASQVAVGEENNLNIRIYGDRASLQWQQQQPNQLLYKPWQHPTQVLTTASSYLLEAATLSSRLPSGHPEGYIEAFANIYRAFAERIRSTQGKSQSCNLDYPGINDALRGMQFIESLVASNNSDQKWYQVKVE